MSGRQDRKIAWITRVPHGAVSVFNAVLAAWLNDVRLLPIYLLIRLTDWSSGETLQPQVIISRLRDIYRQINVDFSVVSEKHGRMLISVSSSNPPAEPAKEPLLTGSQSS